MIFGIGTDIVNIERIEQGLSQFGDKMAARILTDTEYSDFLKAKNQANFLAKRFAAKEAASKALGLGLTNGVAFKDIEVAHKDSGQPILNFLGSAKEFITAEQITQAFISISDEKDHAIAYVVLEQNDSKT